MVFPHAKLRIFSGREKLKLIFEPLVGYEKLAVNFDFAGIRLKILCGFAMQMQYCIIGS
jgi:hypothetical protein